MLETSMTEILSRYEEQNKLEKSEVEILCLLFHFLAFMFVGLFLVVAGAFYPV